MAVCCRWATIPICIALAFFLIGLDDAAVELENPFGRDFNNLPLDTITQTISDNLMELKSRAVRKLAARRNEQVHQPSHSPHHHPLIYS